MPSQTLDMGSFLPTKWYQLANLEGPRVPIERRKLYQNTCGAWMPT